MPVPSHLIFDFFGTLVRYSASRTDQGYRATHAFYRSAGGEMDYTAFVGCWSDAFMQLDASTAESHREYSMREAAEAFCGRASLDAGPDVIEKLAERYLEEWNQGVEYIDGVAAMLSRLAGSFDLSILSNTHDPELVPSHLIRLGIQDLFSQVVTSVAFGRRKPAAEIFVHALDELSVSPDQCVYVGDSFTPDYEGPRAAGMRALLIDAANAAPVAPGDRIASILDLESALTTG